MARIYNARLFPVRAGYFRIPCRTVAIGKNRWRGWSSNGRKPYRW